MLVDLHDNNKWDSVIPKHMKDAIGKAVKRQFYKLPLDLVEKWLEPKYLDKEWFREARKHIDIPYAHLYDEAPPD